MSCEDGEMSRSPAATAAPLDDDNLLSEILVRLPPLPSSLPRVSAVCKRWRSLASDPAFSRRFRRHHRRNPPLLGFFHVGEHGLSFVPTLDAPNRVPPGRFTFQRDDGEQRFTRTLGSRLGLVLIIEPPKILVWNPYTGEQHDLPIPPGFDLTKDWVNGAVLRFAAGDVQHFKVVLVIADNDDSQNPRVLACVYTLETEVWGNFISTPIPSRNLSRISSWPAVLVGDSLFWVLLGNSPDILEFDLKRENLAVMRMPMFCEAFSFKLVRADDGGLSVLSMSGFTAKLWRRKTDCDGVASWEIGTTIELDKLLSLNSDSKWHPPSINGFAEDNNMLLLSINVSLFTLQLDSLEFKRLPIPRLRLTYYAFESVYAAGI